MPETHIFAKEQFAFTDAMNKSVTIGIPAKRIVVLTSDAAEVLSAIGASDLVVGNGGYIAENNTGLLYSLEEKPAVGYPNSPSMEKIIELSPDLVITYNMNIKN